MKTVIEPNDLAVQDHAAMEKRLWSALGAAGSACITRNLDGALMVPQASWAVLTGQTQGELADFGWLDAVHPDDRARIKSHWTTKSSHSAVSYRLRDASGMWRDVEERIARFDGSDGLLPQALCVIEDIGALYKIQQRLRLALVGGKIGTWDIDLSTGFMKCSSQCKANYGRLPEEEFTYENLAASVHIDDLERWRSIVSAALENGGEFDIDYRAVWPDSSVHWVYVRGGCELDGHGRATTLSGVSIDITERKHAQYLEQERAETASRENRKKTEFLAILSHELRGPLGPIKGALKALQTRGEDPKDREWLRTLAERQVKHMSILIDDLLDVARVERGEIRLQLSSIDLRVPLRMAIEACRGLMESRGQHFDEAGFDHPVIIMADATRVTQMVSNLLNNAAKYTPPRGHVRLELSQQQNQASICVIDDGMGLDDEALNRIFDMYEQVESQKAHAQGGLGIGLALTRQLAELHAGSISASSDGIGCGCQFVITLPLLQS